MPPKRISRYTGSIEGSDPSNAFIGLINGKISFVENGSGFDDEDLINGFLDEEALKESGLTDDEIESYKASFEQRLDADLFKDSIKAYSKSMDEE